MPRLRIRRMMLDAADHRRLAEFYRCLLGAQYEPGSEPGQEVEPRFIDLVESATGARLGFQVSENYQRPDWPDHRRVPTQGHLESVSRRGSLIRRSTSPCPWVHVSPVWWSAMRGSLFSSILRVILSVS